MVSFVPLKAFAFRQSVLYYNLKYQHTGLFPDARSDPMPSLFLQAVYRDHRHDDKRYQHTPIPFFASFGLKMRSDIYGNHFCHHMVLPTFHILLLSKCTFHHGIASSRLQGSFQNFLRHFHCMDAHNCSQDQSA